MFISSFDDLLQAAHEQDEPQRLLFVFVQATLPEDSTPEQKAAFEAGEGGELAPVMAVDKAPDEVGRFEDFKAEAEQFGQAWSLVFVSAMAGRDGQAPTSADAEPALQDMVESIKAGRIDNCIPFDPQGRPVHLG